MVYGNVDAADAWRLLPGNVRQDFEAVAEKEGDVMQQLGQGANVFGLIHADAHLDNVRCRPRSRFLTMARRNGRNPYVFP